MPANLEACVVNVRSTGGMRCKRSIHWGRYLGDILEIFTGGKQMGGGLLVAAGAIPEIPETLRGVGTPALVGTAGMHGCCRPAKGCSGVGAGSGYRLTPSIHTARIGGSQADIKKDSGYWYKNCNIQVGNHFLKTLDIEQMFCYTIFVRNKRRSFMVINFDTRITSGTSS